MFFFVEEMGWIEDMRTKSTQVQFFKISSSIFTSKSSLFKCYISSWFLHDWMCKCIEQQFMKIFWIKSFTFAGFEEFSDTIAQSKLLT